MSPETIRAALEARARQNLEKRSPWAESDQILVIILKLIAVGILLAISVHGYITY